MAARGWGGSVATAVGVAAGAGAAQLGFGYGLGIIAWVPAAGGSSEAAWVASLTWAAWIAATSTVAGAVCAYRLGGSGQRPTGSGQRPVEGGQRSGGGGQRSAGRAGDPAPTLATMLWRAVLAVSSAIGALVTVVLVAVPARSAVRVDTSAPQTVAAGYAVLGVLLGLVAAIWAISSPAVASNVLGTVCWLWALAVISVVDGVLSGRGLSAAQLGVWQLTSDGERFWFREYFYWPGAALSLGSALLIGALAARSAARRPATRVGAAVSGISGPLLVAVAYFLAAPRLVGIRPEQVSAHLMAPYAVVAGLAGSALVAALAQRAETIARQGDPGDAGAEPLPSGTGPQAPAPATDADPALPPPGTDSRPTEADRSAPATAAAASDQRTDGTGDSETGTPGGAGTPSTGTPGGAGRRLPGQPGRRARRDADRAATSGVPLTPAAPTRAGTEAPAAPTRAGTEAGAAPTADGPEDVADRPADGTDATAGAENPAGPVTEDGAKGGRLGRFGRRSR